jgi:pyrroline-5-carboxylate reductase
MRIAVLGCGNMGQALINGLRKKHPSGVEIYGYDTREDVRSLLKSTISIAPPQTWFASKQHPEVVIIAVKPQDVGAALAQFHGAPGNTLWLSIAAGITINVLGTMLPAGSRICRAMPNTPALIGEGISAYSCNASCSEVDTANIEMVLTACGHVINVPEKMMDAVTGLSGSGPAYVYLFIESLIEGGVTAGLPYSIAAECAVQTVIGAARMVQESGESPAVLKTRVMSPGGTTVSGLLELEKQGFKCGILNAVTAAAEKAGALRTMLKK